jgi:hypothetical protein
MKIVFTEKVFIIMAIFSLLFGLFSLEFIEGFEYFGVVLIIFLLSLKMFFIDEKYELKYIAIVFTLLAGLSVAPSFIHEKAIGETYYESGGTRSNPIEVEGYKTEYEYLYYFDEREINFLGVGYAFYFLIIMFGFYLKIIVVEKEYSELE